MGIILKDKTTGQIIAESGTQNGGEVLASNGNVKLTAKRRVPTQITTPVDKQPETQIASPASKQVTVKPVSIQTQQGSGYQNRLLQQADVSAAPVYENRMIQQAVPAKPTTTGGSVGRTGNILEAIAKGTTGTLVNLGGLTVDAVGAITDAFERNPGEYAQRQARLAQETLERGTLDDGRPLTPGMRQSLEEAAAKFQAEAAKKTLTEPYEERHPVLQNVEETLYKAADTMAGDAQRNTQEAKKGLGKLGQFAVDAAIGGGQLVGDVALGAVTGGGALPVMLARGIGGGAQEARKAGASTAEQLAYGVGSGLVSVATERIANVAAPFKAAFGTGVLDNVISKVMGRLGSSAAGKLALSAISEGGEEFVEAVFQPVLQRATYDEDAAFNMEEALYSAAIGAVLGGIGGAGDVVVNRKTDIMPKLTGDQDTELRRMTQAVEPYRGGRTAQDDFNSRDTPDHMGAVALLRENLGNISDMKPVAAVTGSELPGEGRPTERAMAFINALGGKVHRPGLGDVLFSKGKIKNSLLGHGFGKPKLELMAAVPGVIRDGRQIGGETNWKGRGYDSLVFAAPVEYRGGKAYLTVIVIRDNANRYYLHEAVDQNGDLIYGQNKSPATASDGSAEDLQSTVAGTELSKTSVAQSGAFDNQKNVVPDILPKLTRHDEPPMVGEPTVEELAERADGSQSTAQPAPMRQRIANSMQKLGIRIVGDLADYTGIEYVRGADEGRKTTIRSRKEAERRLQPTRGEKRFAKGIAEGDYTLDDIPSSMSRATVAELADLYHAENTYKGTDGVQRRGQEIREQTERKAAELFKDEEGFKPIPMLLMNERTPERVMRSIFGDRQGEVINREYIYPVQQNEAEKMRFIQRQLSEVRTFMDSSGQRSELTKQERQIVQQIMEDRFVGESVAAMEMAESIRNAAENIMNGEDPVDAGREFGLDAEERGLAQQLARWTQNQELLASGQLDSVKINNAVQKFAQQYDLFYDAVNDFLTAHGYGTIGFIKGYAPHMQGADTQNKLLSALRSMGVNTDASNLPTSISGLTADYKPGKRWVPFFQSRMGSETDYDVSAGYESYVSYLGDIFYHTDDIARLRGVSRYLRKTYATEELNHAIDHAESLRNVDLNTQLEALTDAGKISEGTVLTQRDARKLIDQYVDELYDNVVKITKYGEFVKYIENYANLLAGKQSMADRGMEYTAGRTSLNAGNKLVAAFGRAQVAGNLSSVLNQSAQLSQILAEVDGKHVAQAALDLTKSTGGKLWNIKKTDLFDQSDLLTSKKGIEYLTADDSRLDSFITALFKPADIMDGLVSALAVQSKYNQLIAEGKAPDAAMMEADRWATSVMASRAKGSRPLTFESKNVVNQLLHMFQVEALNSWEHLTFDLPHRYKQIAQDHGKKAGARAWATVVTKGLLSAFLLNRMTEAAYGGTPAPFDLLGYIANFVSSGMGMSTNEWLKRVLNRGWEKLFGEALFDEEEKEKQPFDWGRATGDAMWNLGGDIPIARNALGVLGLGDQTMPFTNMAEAGKELYKAVKAEDRNAEEIASATFELGSTLVPGGRQIQKTWQGAWTMGRGGRHYGFGDERRLQYPVEPTPGNWAQALMFGNSGLDETREFYASGKTGLSKNQTDAVELIVREGGDRTAAYNAVQDIRAAGGKTADEMQALNAADLSDRQKWQLYSTVIASKGSKKVEQFRQMLVKGMSWDQITAAYLEYNRLDEMEGITASEQATQYAAWLDRSGLSEEQKQYVKDELKFYSMVPAEAQRYEDLTALGIDTTNAQGLAQVIGSLEPEGDSTSVSNLQRYEAVVKYSGVSETEKMSILKDMMSESGYMKLAGAYNVGVSLEEYFTFQNNIKDISGENKKARIMGVIDSMRISNSQKTALYYAAGYKESTLDEAPWYGKGDLDITPRLTGAENPFLRSQNNAAASVNPFQRVQGELILPTL